MLQVPGWVLDEAAAGFPVATYAYALNNPLAYSDSTGLFVDGQCWAKCIDDTNPISNNPWTGRSLSTTNTCGATVQSSPLAFGIPKALLPSWLVRMGSQAGASSFTTAPRVLNVVAKSTVGVGATSGTIKVIGRGGQTVLIGVGLSMFGVVTACAVACSE